MDIKDHYQLSRVEDIPTHKTKKYIFISNEVFIVNKYESRKCYDIYCPDGEEAAWVRLEKFIEERNGK